MTNLRKKYYLPRLFFITLLLLLCGRAGGEPDAGFSIEHLFLRELGVASLQLLHSEDFAADLSHWVVEEVRPGYVSIHNGQLDMDDAGGSTVWFKQRLSAPLMIEFEATAVDRGGANDRLSDLNVFWMATDPQHPNDLFAQSAYRSGYMRRYDNLQLYYLGYGANNNTTTRFRRYPGDGSRPLLPQHDLTDPIYMNVANQPITLRLINVGDKLQVRRDNILVYDITDKTAFEHGWFGFRTWKSHLKLDNFRVYQLHLET